MDESPNNYVEWKRPESSLSGKKKKKKDILYGSIYIKL